MRLDGIFPAVTTPFSADGAVDHEALQENLQFYFSTDLAGVLLLGSTGEAIHLDHREKLQILETGSRLIPEGKRLLVGLAGGSSKAAATFARELESLPVTALLAGVPAYYRSRITPQALTRYYREVADASPFPLLLYNVPQFTGFQIPVQVAADLSRHPRILGMKESSGDLIYVQEILSRADPNFQILTGSAQVLGPCLTLGIGGAILAVACAFPDMPIRLTQAYASGEASNELQKRLFRLAQVTAEFGIAGLKYAMDRVGLRGGLCRLPLLPLDDREQQSITRVLDELGVAPAQPGGRRITT